jgi:PAS domain S-box-containing protein
VRAKQLGAIAIALVAIDVVRLFVHGIDQVAFTDGFETLVVAACAIACVRTARRGRDIRWLLAATFFVGMFAADLHDFVVDVAGADLRFLAYLGWTTYIPIALLVVLPRKAWTWLTVIDLAQITLIFGVAYFYFIYLAHLDTGRSWTTRVPADDMRNIVLSVGLLVRAAVEASADARRFYSSIGAMFGVVTLLHVAFHHAAPEIVLIARPAALMAFGIVAATWCEPTEARARYVFRPFALPSWAIVLFPACGPLLVLLLLAVVPIEYRGTIDIAMVGSTALFAARVAYAEHLRETSARALAASDARYRLLFERSSAGVFRTTLDGQLLECNDACARILGYADKEEAMRAKPLAPFAELVREAREEIAFERHDGRTIHALASVTVSDAHAEGTLVDISERHALEERLRAGQKMEAIGRLAGGIAHDFNNVLTAITLCTQTVQRRLPAGDSQRAVLDQVLAAASHASGLTKQLLAFSRAGVVARRALDLGPIIASTTTLLARVLGDNIQLRVELDEQTSPVNADRGQIEQVIMNLAINARDAMPRGGVLTISLGELSVSGRKYAVLVVRDTGHGMSSEVQRKIFDPFFTTKEQRGGTGLGLATVYGIVEQHGGTIQVSSAVDAGTTIEIFLPCVEVAVVAPPPREAALLRGRETLLVVDDEPVVRDYVADLLRSLGYTVVAAGSGAEALALEASHPRPIDVLVTDVMMPEMSGVELAATMRTRRRGLRVLFVSGYAEGIADDEHFLAKPFSAEQLAQTLREILAEPALAASIG